MSAATSNLYYPPASRSLHVTAVDWGTNLMGSAFVNLVPEFWQDFDHWMKHHLHHER